jgi:3-oxoacyl-[acyl-carrier protein] reductase
VKTALVTGSSVRTGREIGLHLARQGWRVVVHGRPGGNAEAQEAALAFREAGGDAVVALADISTEAGCRELSSMVPEGPLDLLVHNVGIYRPGPLLAASAGDWTETLRTNLDAPFHLTRQLVDRMPAGSSIVAIGYVGTGKLAGTLRTGAYSVSKTGLLVLVRSLALELGPRGIRVNMVSPGQLENSVDLPDDISRRVPLGRAGRVEEVAQAVAWLASDDAAYVTGQELEVAGGLMLSLKGQ